ncbi:MAG: hypothetical protein M1836_007939 [Candelina mexicana]|nr:MAG: hypothetical protein M1836_007939 [Candelina mexicana]
MVPPVSSPFYLFHAAPEKYPNFHKLSMQAQANVLQMSEADYLEAVEAQLFSETEGLSTRADTPTTSEDTISASNNNHNVSTTYVTVTIIEGKRPVKNPSLLRLQDYSTAQAFAEALLGLDRMRSFKETSIKYTWWSDQWFDFRIHNKKDFRTMLDIVGKFKGDEDCIVQIQRST